MLLPPADQHVCALPLVQKRPGFLQAKVWVPDGEVGYTWDCGICGAVWMVALNDAGDECWRGADMQTAFKHRQRTTAIRLRQIGGI